MVLQLFLVTIGSLIANKKPYASIDQIINTILQLEPKAYKTLKNI